jgi:DNA-binding MarR family transcriptional regulator
MAFRSLMDEMHARLAKRGVRDIRPAYGFVLLAARERPLGVGDVGELLGTTKQAASKLVDNLEADGYVTRVASKSDARERRIELTARGHQLLEKVEVIYRELEREWSEIIGRDRVEAMRADIQRVLEHQNDGALPPVRPTW